MARNLVPIPLPVWGSPVSGRDLAQVLISLAQEFARPLTQQLAQEVVQEVAQTTSATYEVLGHPLLWSCPFVFASGVVYGCAL